MNKKEIKELCMGQHERAFLKFVVHEGCTIME